MAAVETAAISVSTVYTVAMRDILIITGVLVLALFIGMLMFFYTPGGSPAGAEPSQSRYATFGSESPTPFMVLAHGTVAPEGIGEVNYRITNQDDFAQLWSMTYGDNATPPPVDFSRDEVLAVFDGSHATGGYDVAVSSIADGDTRTVTVEHDAPASDCMVSESESAPFEIVSVAKTNLQIAHADTQTVQSCQ